MRRRYTIVAEFDDDSPVFADSQRAVIRAMPPELRVAQIKASLHCDVPNLFVLDVTETELVDIILS